VFVLLSVALLAEAVWALHALGTKTFEETGTAQSISSVRDIGISLFTDHAFAFEVTSVLILVAMVGAVVLAKKQL
jgi:NADH-quinone oxidoreductase subunit J